VRYYVATAYFTSTYVVKRWSVWADRSASAIRWS